MSDDIKEGKFYDFFDNFKNFKNKQQKQKQRGLNNYNMVNVVRKANDEVGMHSSVISSLINPRGSHYQNSLFLRLFLEKIGLSDFFKTDLNDVKVEKEYQNIDLYLTNGKQHLIIENKIWAKDQPCQIIKYINLIIKNNSIIFPNIKENDCVGEDILRVVYLTARDKKCPDEHKVDEKEYITYNKDNKDIGECKPIKIDDKDIALENYSVKFHVITYKENILKWIDACQKEVSNITNLNEAFNNYKHIVQKITKQYKGNVMTMYEYMKEHEEMYESMYDIQKNIPEVAKGIEQSFWDELQKALEDNFQYYKNEKNKPKRGLESEKNSIKIERNHNLYIIDQNNILKNEAINQEKFGIKLTKKNENENVYYFYEQKNAINFQNPNPKFWDIGVIKKRKELIDFITLVVKEI